MNGRQKEELLRQLRAVDEAHWKTTTTTGISRGEMSAYVTSGTGSSFDRWLETHRRDAFQETLGSLRSLLKTIAPGMYTVGQYVVRWRAERIAPSNMTTITVDRDLSIWKR